MAIGPGSSVRVVDQPHGAITSAGRGFEAGGRSIGYSTDCNELTDDMARLFEGVDVWVADAAAGRIRPIRISSRRCAGLMRCGPGALY